MSYALALKEVAPGRPWYMDGESYEGITMLDGGAKPAKATLDAALAAAVKKAEETIAAEQAASKPPTPEIGDISTTFQPIAQSDSGPVEFWDLTLKGNTTLLPLQKAIVGRRYSMIFRQPDGNFALTLDAAYIQQARSLAADKVDKTKGAKPILLEILALNGNQFLACLSQ